MKLFVNLSSVFKGGAEQVALSFINECRDFRDNHYYVFLCNNLVLQLDIKSFPQNFTFFIIDERPGKSLKSYLKFVHFLNKKEKKLRPDCVLSTSSHGYWKPKSTPIVAGFNIPHFVYPESPYFKKIGLIKNIFWFIKKKFHLYFYNRLNIIFVQTEDVKERLTNMINNSVVIHVISNTVNAHYLNPVFFSNKIDSNRDNQYKLLTLSAYYPHKNLEIIASVIKVLIKRKINKFRFIVTLPSEKFELLFGKFPVSLITNIGPIPVKECPSLYRECDAMFLPTLLECFSASYAEAMLMKKPIITSDLGFAQSVCKDAAIYFNPCKPDDIVDKIIRVYEDEDLQKNMINNGIEILKNINSANQRASSILGICQNLIKYS